MTGSHFPANGYYKLINSWKNNFFGNLKDKTVPKTFPNIEEQKSQKKNRENEKKKLRLV